MKKNIIIIIFILAISFLLFTVYILQKKQNGGLANGNINKEEPTACAMDAKLCSDGSYVSRILPQCDFAPCPKQDLIQVETPSANETISSPLVIKGKARGYWFFEASFPIKLLDANGNLVAQSFAQAQGEWMTEDFVPFNVNLKFTAPATSQGLLILEKDNPSGLPENADELRIPISFSGQEVKMRSVKLYYYNSELDKDESGNIACSRNGLMFLEREIPITKTPLQDTISLLLLGDITEEERAQGITTEYPLEGFSLKGALLKDGVLTLEFDDLNNKSVGGSCRVGILWFQIEATARQFPEVQQVRFLPEDIFQP